MAVAVLWLVIVVAVFSKNLESASINHDKPVHEDIVKNGDKVEKTSALDATFIQPESPNAKVSPPALSDPGTDLHGPSDDSKKPTEITNAHTITAQDFAAVLGVQEPDSGGTNNEASPNFLDPADKPGLPDKGVEPENNIDEQNQTPELVLQEEGSSNGNNGDTIDKETPEFSSPAKADTGEISSSDIAEDPQSQPLIDKSVSLTEFSHKVSDEIKEPSNNVLMSLQQRHDAAWTSEAKSTLKYYMEKINVAISANNENCVISHKANHKARSEALEGVIEACKSGLKRENLEILQKETKEILGKINAVVLKAEYAIEALPKDINYNSKKLEIEENAKKEIKEIASEKVKTNLSNLKNEAIKTDESEYTDCLNGKSEKSMIDDTLKDIMTIKDYCA